MKTRIESTLNLFPEVMWDRWSGEMNYLSVFGWIKRPDTHEDFVLLVIIGGEVEHIFTSSAEYSDEFSRRLGYTSHKPCQRVEKSFINTKHIKLSPEFPTDGSFNPLYHEQSIANEGTE